MERRRDKGPKSGGRPKLPNSAHSLVRICQKEVARQQKMVLKATPPEQRSDYTPPKPEEPKAIRSSRLSSSNAR